MVELNNTDANNTITSNVLDPDILRLNNATSQYDRWLKALDPNYAQVDDLSLTELMNFAVKFAGLINFYDVNDSVDGDWVDFFQSDAMMLLANIEGIGLTGLERDFSELLTETANTPLTARKFIKFTQCFDFIVKLAAQFDLWLQAVDSSDKQKLVVLLINEIIELIEHQLAPALDKLSAYALGASQADGLKKPIKLALTDLLPIWQLGCVRADSSIYCGSNINQKIDHALPFLQAIFDVFSAGIAQLKTFAQGYLSSQTSTDSNAKHRPQIALFMAFARLYHYAQNSINSVSERYSHFYYDQILKEQPQAAIADQLYLNFNLEEDENSSGAGELVSSDTLFSAGQTEAGDDILYKADHDLSVTSAKLFQLYTLFLQTGELGVQSNPPVLEKILTAQRMIDQTLVDQSAIDSGLGWPTFGGATLDEEQSDTPAKFGLAISSPYLYLSGGGRCIFLDIQYSQDYQDTVLTPLLQQIKATTGCSEKEIFKTLLGKAFQLYASTSSAWFEIESYEVAVSDDPQDCSSCFAGVDGSEPIKLPRTFRLCIKLAASSPALVAYQSESELEDNGRLNQDIPVTSELLPTLKFYLRQQAVAIEATSTEYESLDVYPLSLLNKMTIDSFKINTQVSQLNDIELSNTDGEIDPSSPFAVFGGLPVVGAYIQLSQAELFIKGLATLQLSINWFNLPPNENGFTGYYQDYLLGPDGKTAPDLFNNQSFKGNIEVIEAANWQLKPVSTEPFLFRTKQDKKCCPSPPSKAGSLCSVTLFDDLKLDPADSSASTNSAIRITLSQPSYAFGNDLYAKNVLNAVIAALPDTESCQEQCLAEYQGLNELKTNAETCLTTCFNVGFIKEIVSREVTKCSNCIECIKSQLGCNKTITLADFIKEYLAPYLDQVKDPDQKAAFELQLTKVEEIDSCSSLEGIKACLQTLIALVDKLYSSCLEICMNNCMSLKSELNYPNDPYLPQASAISVNYTANCMLFDNTNGEETHEDNGCFFYLQPFMGYSEPELVAPDNSNVPIYLLPQFSEQGNLYLGLAANNRQFFSPQSLSLLFQLAESTGLQLPAVQWSVLSHNHWQQLAENQVLSDSTYGLQNSGIVSLSLPSITSADNTLLNCGYTWLRVSVDQRSDQFANSLDIFPHALSATLFQEDGVSHGDQSSYQATAAYTITSSVQDLANISEINQPMGSFGGRAAQNYAAFKISMGERLRHKDRAIQQWDLQRLVLERFPTIWKVAVLPAHNQTQANMPGNVLVVVVAGPDEQANLVATAPTVSHQLLRQIQIYLTQRSSPFIQLHVTNPLYVRITVGANIVLRDNNDRGSKVDELNQALIDYLSPWFYDQKRAEQQGDYVSEAAISTFIQTYPSVAALTEIRFSYSSTNEELKLEQEQPTADWCFVTSAEQHNIFVQDDKCQPPINCPPPDESKVVDNVESKHD